MLFEDAETLVRTHSGRDLMPLAPVHLEGHRNVAGDLTVTWVRRTGIGGAWRDRTGSAWRRARTFFRFLLHPDAQRALGTEAQSIASEIRLLAAEMGSASTLETMTVTTMHAFDL